MSDKLWDENMTIIYARGAKVYQGNTGELPAVCFLAY